MKYKNTNRPAQPHKQMGREDRPRTAPANALDSQQDHSEKVGDDLSMSVGGTRTHPKKGKRRWEHPTWKDKLKQKFRIIKRKKKKN